MTQMDKSKEGRISVGGAPLGPTPNIFHVDCGDVVDGFSVLALDFMDGATKSTCYIWYDHTDSKLVFSTTEPTAHDSSHTDS